MVEKVKEKEQEIETEIKLFLKGLEEEDISNQEICYSMENGIIFNINVFSSSLVKVAEKIHSLTENQSCPSLLLKKLVLYYKFLETKLIIKFLVNNEVTQVITNDEFILKSKSGLKKFMRLFLVETEEKEKEENKVVKKEEAVKKKESTSKNKKKKVEEENEEEEEEEEVEEEIEKIQSKPPQIQNPQKKSANFEKDSITDLLISEDIEFMEFLPESLNSKFFLDGLNDIIFYLQEPLQKTALIFSNSSSNESVVNYTEKERKNMKINSILKEILIKHSLNLNESKDFLEKINLEFYNNDSTHSTNPELFLLMSLIIKTKQTTIEISIQQLIKNIKEETKKIMSYYEETEDTDEEINLDLETENNRNLLEIKENDLQYIKLLKTISKNLINNLKTDLAFIQNNQLEKNNSNSNLLEILILFHKEINKKAEFLYKCAKCRKTIFSDLNIDDYHQYTPKQQYSFKRYKHSFVNTNQCSSFLLKDVEEIFVKDKYGEKGVKNKVKYKINDFYNTHHSVKLECLKVSLFFVFNFLIFFQCGNKIGEYYPTGMQCSCGSWVVPACQIVKSKVDKLPLNFNLSLITDVTYPVSMASGINIKDENK